MAIITVTNTGAEGIHCMKKYFKISVIFILAFTMLFFSGCGSVKVLFDIGDAELISGEIKQKYKDGIEIVPPEINKDGYALVGWEGNYISPEKNQTITPIWKKIHTVKFELDGGTSNDSVSLTQQIIDGEAAIAPAPEKNGFSFEGWDTDFSSVSEDMTVTAKWKALHKVTFDLNGGATYDTNLLSQLVKDGEAAVLPVVQRKRYNFVKWDKDVSNVKRNTTVKAVWERAKLSVSEIFNVVNPSTVEINTYRLNDIHYSTGSGFFLDKYGDIVTNYHVIENARKIVVKMHDGKEYTVSKVVSYDKEFDIAILHIELDKSKISYLEVSDKKVKVGDPVFAIGSSLGLTGTFSSGIVSQVNRTVSSAPNVKFIQTTTPISSGNSGGPLVDEYGLVIGINSMSYTEGQNLNLAIDISCINNLKKVNLTPEELFQKEGTVKWIPGENVVKETAESIIGQKISLGDTVEGSIVSTKELDTYFVDIPEESGIIAIFVYCESLKDIQNIGFLPILSNVLNIDKSVAYPEEYYQMTAIPSDDGYILVTAIVVDEDIIKDYGYLGFIVGGKTPMIYDTFIYSMTMEEFKNIFTK